MKLNQTSTVSGTVYMLKVYNIDRCRRVISNVVTLKQHTFVCLLVCVCACFMRKFELSKCLIK